MKKLKNELGILFRDKLQILTPKNCQLVKLKLVAKKNAKILGQLAKEVILNIQKHNVSIHNQLTKLPM